jgi:hypothetical protein
LLFARGYQGRSAENIRSAIEEYLAARDEMIFSDPEIQRVEIAL